MWIVYVVTAILGGLISWVSSKLGEIASNKEKYTKTEFSERINRCAGGLAWLSVFTSFAIMCGLVVAISKENKETDARFEKIEAQVEEFKALNQVGTIVVYRLLDEEDLK